MDALLIASTTQDAKHAPTVPCPHCGQSCESRVVDSRGGIFLRAAGRRTIGVYRRRECLNPACRARFTTHEVAVDHN